MGGNGNIYIGRKAAGFERVIDYINCAFKMNQVVSVNVVCKCFCDNECVDMNRHRC